MTKEDILRMMQEADPNMLIDLKEHEEGMEGFTGEDPKLLRFWSFETYVKFAALVAEHEREACAQIVEKNAAVCTGGLGLVLDTNAMAIRARSKT